MSNKAGKTFSFYHKDSNALQPDRVHLEFEIESLERIVQDINITEKTAGFIAIQGVIENERELAVGRISSENEPQQARDYLAGYLKGLEFLLKIKEGVKQNHDSRLALLLEME